MEEGNLLNRYGSNGLNSSELIRTFILLIIPSMVLLIVSCGNKKSKDSNNNEKDSSFVNTLKEIRIDSSNYFISLPQDYSLKTSVGPDFIVYYFSPSDTSIKVDYSGGMYFGGYPSTFGPDNDSCSKEKVKNKILNKDAEWDVYKCNDTIFSIETVIDEGDYEKIHAFGHARYRRNMFKLFDIYSTLTVKK